jgi:hypothetical protein
MHSNRSVASTGAVLELVAERMASCAAASCLASCGLKQTTYRRGCPFHPRGPPSTRREGDPNMLIRARRRSPTDHNLANTASRTEPTSTGLRVQLVDNPHPATKNASMPAGGCIARNVSINNAANPTPTAIAVSPEPKHHSAANPATHDARCPTMTA